MFKTIQKQKDLRQILNKKGIKSNTSKISKPRIQRTKTASILIADTTPSSTLGSQLRNRKLQNENTKLRMDAINNNTSNSKLGILQLPPARPITTKPQSTIPVLLASTPVNEKYMVELSNLAPNTTVDDLKVIMNCRGDTNRFNGTVVVTFRNSELGEKAISRLHNQVADGRTLKAVHQPTGISIAGTAKSSSNLGVKGMSPSKLI
ncbi:hypothetical protein HDV02_006268 [Globomyces sp. JEL0801]|nr:hypothetical protein HDV02_006268 [Globomyces sp. JEL0801]